MIKTPEIILERWIEYVNKLEVDKVVGLYDKASTILPTFSPHSVSTPEDIKEYFMQLSTRKNISVNIHNETLRKYEIGEDKYVLMGTYSFSFMVDDANLNFPSRFTFILDISKERPILHHHSSQIPRTLS
ncbi:MAG: ketosteroid isomerase family protein [Planctomycetota bacterium]|jgi:hypothetical protein